VKIDIAWSKPTQLRSGRGENLIYRLPDLDALPHGPGVYVFGRVFPDPPIVPLYIGQADRLRRRIRQQLNNTRPMVGLTKAPRVRRFLLIGEYLGRPGLVRKKR